MSKASDISSLSAERRAPWPWLRNRERECLPLDILSTSSFAVLAFSRHVSCISLASASTAGRGADTQTHKQRDTDRHTDTQTERHRQTHRHTNRETQTERHKQRDQQKTHSSTQLTRYNTNAINTGVVNTTLERSTEDYSRRCRH